MNSHFSKIIAGVMRWAHWGAELQTNEMSKLIEQCVECGVHSFDHADIYGGYTTEARFGQAFGQSGVRREDIQLISKCGIQYQCENRPLKVGHYDYSKSYIIKSVEQSLVHLKTDYLDLLLLHRPSPLLNIEEVTEAVQSLLKQGKILALGVSNFNTAQTNLIAKNNVVAFNQIELSLTHHQPMHDGSLEAMQAQGIRPMAWSPLGHYFGPDTPQNQRLKPLLQELSESYNASEDQLLLAWLFRHPAKIIPVVGTSKIERIRLAIEAQKIQLKTEDWFRMLVESQGHKVP